MATLGKVVVIGRLRLRAADKDEAFEALELVLKNASNSSASDDALLLFCIDDFFHPDDFQDGSLWLPSAFTLLQPSTCPHQSKLFVAFESS